jgi:hypothetical protein
MSLLLRNVTNSIWHAFNSLTIDRNGLVMKSKLKVMYKCEFFWVRVLSAHISKHTESTGVAVG